MTRFLLTSSPLVLSLALSACIIDKDLGDTPGSTSVSTTEPDSSSSASEPGTTSATDGPGQLCPDSPDFSCTVPFTCVDFPCGGLHDRLDADGCPRRGCNPDFPCPEGQVCYDTGAWGDCNASALSCADEGDACRCEMTLDCQQISYCVPAEIGPPADCNLITDAQACQAAGCDQAGGSVRLSLVDDACVCGEPEPVCLWFQGDINGADIQAPFYRKDTDEVVLFPTDWSTAPHGWRPCADDPAAPPACACAETCAP